MARKIVHVGPWRFVWERGNRLMDVHYGDSEAVDCVQTGPYDGQTGTSHATDATMRAAAREWVRDHAEEYYDNVVRYM